MKVYIIGGGIIGFSTAYHLSNHCDVTVFEKDNSYSLSSFARSCGGFRSQFFTPINVDILQNTLTRTELLIGHNIKYDLQWLLSCGFKYGGLLWDTMGVEYLLARGLHRDLSLSASCKRRDVTEKKSEIFDSFIKAGKGVDEISWDKLVEYGEQDVESTYELALVQAQMLKINLEEWPNEKHS